ncbi:hypothetical protein EJ110_NYTH04458 [Nymphaea thermarum]|nr:hypothetical protein EJ110_NYTH04458 [Nymphaea thermarum]
MKGGSKDAESLTEEERRALRASRFSSSLPPPSAASTKPRMPHPGGPVATNKAAALAKFLERKLQEPGGLTSVDPLLVESAVRHAKGTLKASSSSKSGHMIKHVTSFADDGEGSGKSEDVEIGKSKKKKKKKKRKLEEHSKKAKKKKKMKHV